MAATKRFAPRRVRAALLAALLAGAPAAAQSDKPLDLRIPPSDMAPNSNALCGVCGEIRSIREVNVGRTQAAQAATVSEHVGPRPSIDEWRVVGAVVYLPLGGGAKSDEGWRVGAMGTPEVQAQFGQSSYEIEVLMDGGERRTIQRRDGSRFKVGQRVTLRSGELEPASP